MPVGSLDGYSGSRWPADYALAALDARNGEPIWLRLAGGAPAGTYYNIPALRSNTLYTGIATPVAGLTEFRAAAVDAGSGESRWSTYLGTGSDPMTSTDGSPPAVGDDIVWVESSLHTLNALDALTGDILWIFRYQPRPTPYYRSGWQDTMTQTNEPLSLITTAGGRLYFSPRWGDDCVAMDGRTGKLIWTKPKGDARTLFAVDAQRCYLCGDQVQALDVATGASKWTWAVPDSYGGLAALAGNRVYVPVGPMVYVLDATNGQKIEEIDLRKFNVEPGYNCVTIIGGRLYLSLPDRLVAYEQPGVPQSAAGRQEIAQRPFEKAETEPRP
jgi:outer membrane protein assembly factor BamB